MTAQKQQQRFVSLLLDQGTFPPAPCERLAPNQRNEERLT